MLHSGRRATVVLGSGHSKCSASRPGGTSIFGASTIVDQDHHDHWGSSQTALTSSRPPSLVTGDGASTAVSIPGWLFDNGKVVGRLRSPPMHRCSTVVSTPWRMTSAPLTVALRYGLCPPVMSLARDAVTSVPGCRVAGLPGCRESCDRLPPASHLTCSARSSRGATLPSVLRSTVGLSTALPTRIRDAVDTRCETGEGIGRWSRSPTLAGTPQLRCDSRAATISRCRSGTAGRESVDAHLRLVLAGKHACTRSTRPWHPGRARISVAA